MQEDHKPPPHLLDEIPPMPVEPQDRNQDGSFQNGTQEASSDHPSKEAYFPFLETLRLYAGWLLAWYALVYALGSYQFLKELPFRIPYAESLFLSPLVFSFTFAAYLFLLCTTLYIALHRNTYIGFFLFILGVGSFVLYRMNIV